MTTSPLHPLAPAPHPHHVVRDYSRILLGLVVVTLGVLFLLESADVLDAGETIGNWWPALVIATGIFQIVERSHGWFEPGAFLTAGSVLLLVTTGVISGNAWDFVWPTAIIVAGLFIITRWHAVAGGRQLRGEDTIVADGIFGGPSVASGSQHFRGGSLTAVFGGVTLDLRSAMPAAEGAVISATAVFGGVEIVVPHGWHVVVNATPIFGGVEDKTDHEAVLAPDAPTITIDGLVLFGGIEIRHTKKK